MEKLWENAKKIRRQGEPEITYLKDVIKRYALGQVANEGGYLTKFREAFAKHVGSKFAIPRATGFVALAEAVSVSGASVGSEVLVDSLTHFGAR